MVYDFLVVGAGVVGLTIAIEIQDKFGGKVCVIEKESKIGVHASGRNSGVLHAGIYYKPGTLKGKLSVEGNKTMREYCDERGINQIKGKVIVTKNENELGALRELEKRALANGADVKMIDEKELKEIEPYASTCRQALYSPNTITIDPPTVLEALLEDAKVRGIEVRFDTEMTGLKNKNEATTNNGNIGFGLLVNAAGAYADKIAHMYGVGLQYTMLPYKGIYFQLKDESAHMVSANIYPVPDIRFPFLGVHFTRTPKGKVKIGPTAIAALGKENYGYFDHIKKDELKDIILCNTRKFITDKNYALLGVKEVSKYIPYLFYKEAKKLMPNLKRSDISSYPNAGIRAQLFDKSKQELEMDFIVEKAEKSVHVLNAVSPAFTTSITFAKYVVGFAE